MNAQTHAAGDGGCFAPRRLGHANLFVRDYERAYEFYNKVVGFHEVYRQPDNMASFVSNGNTYHDLALTDTRSPYAAKDQAPGIWHLAFEAETEAELVEGYRRAVDAGVNVAFTMDHDAAHSIYLQDPDGNMVEVYADIVRDWWTVRHGIIIKKKPEWIPGVTNEPVAESRYPVDPDIKTVEGAVFRPLRTSHTGFRTAHMERMTAFYTEVVGLEVFAAHPGGAFTILHGAVGGSALTLLRSEVDADLGFAHVGFPVRDEADLERSLADLDATGTSVEREVDHPARRSVCIRDPDGLRLQFYVDRDWRPEVVAGVDPADAPYLL